MIGWVNGSAFIRSNEAFGILPVPGHTKQNYRILPFDPDDTEVALPQGPTIPSAGHQTSTIARNSGTTATGNQLQAKPKPLRLKHRYLASKQDTKYPVLQVHTVAERRLYRHLVRTSLGFTDRATPDWAAVTSEWNRYANGYDTFYKVSHSEFQVGVEQCFETFCLTLSLTQPASGASPGLPSHMANICQ